MTTITRDFVEQLIDFAPGEDTSLTMIAQQQLDGTVALFNMLQRNRCAYLADEVGMGKTYVALGVMSLIRYLNPQARIVVIAPRENIQRKWIKELKNFVRVNWKIVGNRVKSLQGAPVWEPVYCNNVIDFTQERLFNADRDFFLRMTSFSVALKQPENRRRLRTLLRRQMPWIPASAIPTRTPEGFREAFGAALNAGVPRADLLIVDEGHNLKHGFNPKGSIRNRLMGLAFGHPDGQSPERTWYKPRVSQLLLLSATPFEEDYAAIQRQLAIFGFGDAKLADSHGRRTVSVARLSQPDVSESEKRDIVGQLMVRRVSGLCIGGELHTKNMYRREWRQGGYASHDDPMRVVDPKQRLIVGLMQKKVAEVLKDERFQNSFQIGMLSSFESFLESVAGRRRRQALLDDDEPESVFDGAQGTDDDERRGIDTEAVEDVVSSYRRRFGQSLPHPKLDTTADAFASAFESGEKTLVFVRRIRTVDELASKLDGHFDRWIRQRLVGGLPSQLHPQLNELFAQYERERALRPEERLHRSPVDEKEPELEDLQDARSGEEDGDAGGSETFFAWFFRGDGPGGVLSGAAFQKNRLSGQASVFSTLFEDDYVGWLLNRPDDVLRALGSHLALNQPALERGLRHRAFAIFRQLTSREVGYPRMLVFQAYQAVALERMQDAGGEIGEQARVILDERFPPLEPGDNSAPPGFPDPVQAIGLTTFFTELVKRDELRRRIWPTQENTDFTQRFRHREQRRELISALARLGLSYIDLYVLAIARLGSFDLRQESSSDTAGADLATSYVDLLEGQMHAPGFHAFYELSQASETFDLLLAVNFPDIPSGSLQALAKRYGATLQRQVPVGRMSGGVNKRLVRQFRMPAFPLVLVTTDVLQEGEDLHTFCRRVVHYGITWTPSAIEQRTGRVDRIGGLIQRNLDGREATPLPSEWLQVYYPHLQDTVEVLQVRRVLRRLNRFLELIHDRKGDAIPNKSRVDMAREMLEDLDTITPPAGRLESAFPVREGWLDGALTSAAVEKPDIASQIRHFDVLWSALVTRYVVRPLRATSERTKQGFAMLADGRLMPQASDSPGSGEKRFLLELRSQASGDSTLLRCTSEVGRLDLRNDTAVLDELYELQRKLGHAKVCVHRDDSLLDRVTVEGDLPFSPALTQWEELELLVARTVHAAAAIRRTLVENTEGGAPWND